MSGWAVLTFDFVDSREWRLRFADDGSENPLNTELADDFEYIEKALCRKLINYDNIRAVGIEAHEVYGYYGYGSGADCETILRETAEMWNRAVILRANDTSDTGTATLYEQENGEIEATDEYSENQCSCCGGRTGRVAAAYMLAEHHIEALADFDQVPYEEFYNENGVDQYRT